ncbi:ATP-binding protein [Lederbergia citrea]|uniref:ATP-binding protein n=1 Tax=Lederbergia citrea TaxID=2833581 RepID=UPI001BCA6734|nr:AAA family ATPase [Lederbergia citrea]MBS4177515.1 AAA family ATPase [Lederbergia citrea]
MKLKSLHIYGYGKLIDFQIREVSSLQIIYGENEAGKSTIMSFIHSILFGFPSKQQAILRYEPKRHSAYGGRLILETSTHGEVVIERVKGKSSGDVSIILEDGTRGGEELLSNLLEGMDKAMYQSIFSFNLHGLQEVQRIKGDEIGRYLIAAGTIGTDMLLSAEQLFQKELDQLFKPSGRKPRLNEQIKVLREQEKELKNAKQQNAQYEAILLKKETIERNIAKIEIELRKDEQELQNGKELLRKWPLIYENNQLQSRIKEIGSIQFPANGLARYETILDKIVTISSRISGIKERIRQTHRLLKDHAFIDAFQPMMVRAEKMINEWSYFQHLETVIATLQRKKIDCNERIEAICQELHYPIGGHFREVNLSIDIKGRIKDLLNQDVRLDSKLGEIRTQIIQAMNKQKKMENICQEIELTLLPENEFKQLQIEKQDWENTEQLRKEKKDNEKELELLLQNEARSKHLKKKERDQAYARTGVFLIISIGLLIWTLSSSQWVMSTFAAIALAFSILSLNTMRKNNATSRQESERLKQRIQVLSNTLSKRNTGMDDSLKRYEEQVRLREEWKNSYSLLEQHKQQINELREQEQKSADLYYENQLKLQEIRDELGLVQNFSVSRLDDAYELLLELSQLIKTKAKTKDELKEYLQRHEQWISTLSELSHAAGIEFEEPGETFFQLKKIFKQEQEKTIIQKELTGKLLELTDEARPLEFELEQYQSSLSKLQTLAEVDCEEEFRKKAREFEELTKMQERVAMLTAQLGSNLPDTARMSKSDEEIKERLIALKEKNKKTSVQLDELRSELASVRHQLQLLEEGGSYTEKLHRFHQLRSIFNEESRNWARIAIAKSLVQKIMDNYKKERFPKVVKNAQEYMAFLTDGEYTRLTFLPEGSLVVESSDGVLFDPAELSQGTGEQLYTALRFALVQVLKGDYPFPIIIDDGFVNFDYVRTQKVLRLIEKVSETTQILLFTCHEHIRNHFQDESIVSLPGKKEQLIVNNQ